MRKFMGTLICIMVLLITVYSNAEVGLANYKINDFYYTALHENKIFGAFEIENNSDVRYEEIKYILYLIPNDVMENGKDKTVATNSSTAKAFVLAAKEKKLVAFEYVYPSNIPAKGYNLMLQICNDTSEVGAPQYIRGLNLGDGREYIDFAEGKDYNYYKIKGFENSMSGPYMAIGESPVAYLKVKSTFSENVNVIPEYSVYKMAPYFPFTKTVSRGDQITLKSNETKELKLKLPVKETSGSYFVKIILLSDKGVPISNEYYFRYVVKGESAKISSISTIYDKEKETMRIYTSYLGSADGQVLKNAELTVGVYNTAANEILDRYLDRGDIEATSFLAGYTIKVPEGEPVFKIFANIKSSDDKILASKTVEFSGTEIGRSIEKFKDVSGLNCEECVKMLDSYGIISGYPDGTFKPDNTLTRAELTTIALKLKNVDLSSYEVAKNAFTDVSENHWAYKTINYAYENGIIKGYGEGVFKPNNQVTYQEATTILLNVSGYREFCEKFDAGIWPQNYIYASKSLGIVDSDVGIDDFTDYASRGNTAILTLKAYVIRKD